jgi:hypothetical protein
VRALALEDTQRHRIVIAEAAFPLTLASADFIAAQAMKAYELDRADILLRSTGVGSPSPGDVVDAIGAALGKLEKARVLANDSGLAVLAAGGRCLAMLDGNGWFVTPGSQCGGGGVVRGRIRSAFQVVEAAHGLQQRGETVPSYTVQAIALGPRVVLLATPGQPARAATGNGLIMAPFTRNAPPMPDDERLAAAIRRALGRVRD